MGQTQGDNTYTCTQKPYLQWIRDPHTLKLLNVFKDLHNITHNIKRRKVQGDTLHAFAHAIPYMEEWRRNRERATLATCNTMMQRNNTHTYMHACT